jgi:hypothetical protein
VARARRFSDAVHNVVGRRHNLNIREPADLAKNGLLRDVKPHFVTNLGSLGWFFVWLNMVRRIMIVKATHDDSLEAAW